MKRKINIGDQVVVIQQELFDNRLFGKIGRVTSDLVLQKDYCMVRFLEPDGYVVKKLPFDSLELYYNGTPQRLEEQTQTS